VRHCVREIAIRGCDDENVDFSLLVRAYFAHGPVFQHSQQLGLQGERHFADFIYEQCRAVGNLGDMHLRNMFLSRRTNFHPFRRATSDAGKRSEDRSTNSDDTFTIYGFARYVYRAVVVAASCAAPLAGGVWFVFRKRGARR